MAAKTKHQLEAENEELRTALEDVYAQVGDILGCDEDDTDEADDEDDDDEE